MKLVIVEHPFAGDVATHIQYGRACLHDCLRRGEAPLSSALLYTQPGVLNDDEPDERALGILAGQHWAARADAVVVYTDLGISRGMKEGISAATARRLPIEYRTIPKWRTWPVVPTAWVG